MRPGIASLGIAAALALAAAPGVSAQTLYKLVDKNGKVTYSEKPPKDFDGQVIPLDIDPNRNTATLPKLPPPEAAKPAGGRDSDNPNRQGSPKKLTLEEAQQRLDGAKKAYQSALDNPGEEDIARMGIKGGGTRPIYSDAYKAKLEKLEAAVKAAEEDVRRAGG